VPPEQTHAESFYYKKQMDNRTPMVMVLQDGEELRGSIEWYDRGCIKLHRTDGPNLLVLKHNIKYLFKLEDAENGGGTSDDDGGDGGQNHDGHRDDHDGDRNGDNGEDAPEE
jgi:sRNA-binding regulator protein Hfq